MAIFRWRGPFDEHFREFKELNRLHDEVNRLYDSFFGRKPHAVRTDVFPPINLYEDHDNLYATAELPGLSPDDVQITVEEDSLIIKGARKAESGEMGVSYHRREREQGAFNRKITLPSRIVTAEVQAETKEGVLSITMPKAEEVKPKTIDIKVE